MAYLCTLLSGGGFYLSLLVGNVWPLAWVAAVPVLWLAFRHRNWRVAGLACWLAYALGSTNLLRAYAGWLPAPVLVLGLLAPGFAFAACALGARAVAHRLSPLAAIFAFAAFWTTWDYLLSFGRDGTAVSPAYSQVDVPIIVQSASVFGIWVLTFLLGLVPAGLAMALARRRRAPAIVALVLFAVNAAFGLARIGWSVRTEPIRVALGGDDRLIGAGLQPDATAALHVVDTHAATARTLGAGRPSMIVFPEKVAILEPSWREEALARLRHAARDAHATLVIGFDDRPDRRLNDALVFPADGSAPLRYLKRHMVPVLEDAFMVGDERLMLADRTGIAICKDMDFPATLRRDATGRPTLMAVPAWDFGADGWAHARMAIMRGVENGFALARAANEGLLTLTDAYGRVWSRASTSARGMVTTIGDLPRGPASTVYQRIGDVFAWLSIAAAVLFAALALRGRGRIRPSRTESPTTG